MEPLPTGTQSALEHIKALFHDDYLPEAYEALHEFGNFYPELQHADLMPDIEELRELKKDIRCANRALEMFADFDTWELVREENDIAIFSKGSANEFFIRAEMLMHHSPFSLLAIFSEVDLLSTWCELGRIDVIAESVEVGRPSLFRRVNHFTMKLPWPLSNRDLMLSCTGIPIPQNKSVLLLIQDLENKPEYFGIDLPEPGRGIVRIAIHHCFINIMQSAPDETQVSFIVRSDPKIALLPSALRNWGSKQAIYTFMNAIREQCGKFEGSEYEKRVKNNPQYYDALRDRATKYHFEHID